MLCRRTKNSNVVIYRCEFCQKGFYRVLAYEKHRATHTGIAAAVPCSQSDCDFTYSDMTQLKVNPSLVGCACVTTSSPYAVTTKSPFSLRSSL